jgi:peptidoglycan hydrolase-like protein with peptidoglycan-binding domain
MKKYIILTLLLLPVFAYASIDQNLKYGSKGTEVTELQEFLMDKGFLSQVTGNFFSLTKKAVIAYQASQSLPATGFVGAMTRDKINAELASVSDEEEINTPVVSTPSNDTIVLKNQLIALTTQMSEMVAQQKTQTAQNIQATKAIEQVVTNTTPVPAYSNPPAPVFAPVATTIDVINNKYEGTYSEYPYGWYNFLVSVKDQNGNYMKNVMVNFENPVDNLYKSAPGDFTRSTTGSYSTENIPVAGGFEYIPSTYGTKIINISSGNITKSLTLEVK